MQIRVWPLLAIPQFFLWADFLWFYGCWVQKPLGSRRLNLRVTQRGPGLGRKNSCLASRFICAVVAAHKHPVAAGEGIALPRKFNSGRKFDYFFSLSAQDFLCMGHFCGTFVWQN